MKTHICTWGNEIRDARRMFGMMACDDWGCAPWNNSREYYFKWVLQWAFGGWGNHVFREHFNGLKAIEIICKVLRSIVFRSSSIEFLLGPPNHTILTSVMLLYELRCIRSTNLISQPSVGLLYQTLHTLIFLVKNFEYLNS